jgi:hypothetical protein
MSDRVSESVRLYRSWRIWAAYAALFAVAIPWYWRLLPGGGDWFWWGLPVWAVVSVAGSAAISALTAWLLRIRWPGEQDDSGNVAYSGKHAGESSASPDKEAAA